MTNEIQDEDISHLKDRVSNIEGMFSKLVESINSIKDDLKELK